MVNFNQCTLNLLFMCLQAEGSRDGITDSTVIIQKGLCTPHLLQR